MQAALPVTWGRETTSGQFGQIGRDRSWRIRRESRARRGGFDGAKRHLRWPFRVDVAGPLLTLASPGPPACRGSGRSPTAGYRPIAIAGVASGRSGGARLRLAKHSVFLSLRFVVSTSSHRAKKRGLSHTIGTAIRQVRPAAPGRPAGDSRLGAAVPSGIAAASRLDRNRSRSSPRPSSGCATVGLEAIPRSLIAIASPSGCGCVASPIVGQPSPGGDGSDVHSLGLHLRRGSLVGGSHSLTRLSEFSAGSRKRPTYVVSVCRILLGLR